ncbi:hypothetical protein U472_09250 [Orenia metallireducens]|uniref:PEGA domain-containing protein n=1 Tax=Orenia metallireducens TaxID=1413210 RepID=A0A1C0A7I3_9FIRM|nr:hypothetical protein [Orenia metallireducens]OCL26190.1 hypothetical protein U472_09250 [Orenia metallireducens]
MKRKFLVALLLMVLIITGCKSKISTLNVKLNTEAKVTISREGRSETKVGQNVQFKDKPVGEYTLVASAEGYEDYQGQVILKESDEITEVNLVKIEKDDSADVSDSIKDEETSKIKEETVSTTEEVIESVDLTLNLFDVNNNKLNAEVTLKKDNQVVGKKVGEQVSFKGLEAGEYTVEVSKDGYDKVVKNLNLNQEEVRLPLYILGGQVEQFFIDNPADFATSVEKISEQLKNLKDNEELILAFSYLNSNYSQPKFDLNNEIDRLSKIEYDVRKRGNELVKRYEDDFAFTKANYTLGDQKEFIISSDVKKDKVNATLMKAGEHIYVFVDNNKDIKMEKLDEIVAEFDNVIYPRLTRAKTVDKVVVLLTDFDDLPVTGYFDPADLYANEGNQELIFYLNADRSMNTLLTSMSHQYQHLVFFLDKAKAKRTANDAWIDQGLAQLAQRITGYIDYEARGWSSQKGNGWVYDKEFGYLNNTTKVNLLNHDGSLPFSGASSLFASYLVEQYGAGLIEMIMLSSQEPSKVIEDYTGLDFSRVYLNWMTANVADNLVAVNNDIYKYSSFELNQMPKFVEGKIIGEGIHYIKLDANEGFNLNLSEDSIDNKIGIVLIKKKK